MSKQPPIPKEPRSFAGDKPWDRLRSARPDRRDEVTEVHGQGLNPQRGVQHR
jgi:hypothetical protein